MYIKAIIFDLDGTLIDSIPDIADAANQLMVNHKYPMHDTSSYVKWIGHGALKLLKHAVPENTDDAYLKKLLGEYLEIHTGNCTNKTSLYPGINKILDYLNEQNISISILTNKPHALTLKVFEHYLKNWKFDFVLGQMQGYPKKPDPARACEIADKLKCQTQEMMFIGDSDTDMKTGTAARMIPLGVKWGYGTESSILEAGAKYQMNNTKELLEFLKLRNT
jgi:phosphoglycolate phosphatase